MRKVYVVVEDWAADGNADTSVLGVFASLKEAQDKMKSEAEEFASNNAEYDTVEHTDTTYETYNKGFWLEEHERIFISEQEVSFPENTEKKVYWNEVYKAKQSAPTVDEGEKMTVAEALELGYNMMTVDDPETGKTYRAGYLDTDGEFALYDLTKEQVKNWVVAIAYEYDDVDGYPCLATTLIDKRGK